MDDQPDLKAIMKRVKKAMAPKKAIAPKRKRILPSEDEIVTELARLMKGDGAVAFNACRFLLTHKYNWHTVDTKPEPKPEPLGKKEAANVAAQDAHEDSPGWAELIN